MENKIEKYDQIIKPLLKKIKQVEDTTTTDIVPRAKKCTEIARKGINELKDLLMAEGFSSEEEEIAFFRDIKPGLLARWVYYHHIYAFEINLPVTNVSAQLKSIKNEQKIMTAFFIKNQAFHSYIQSGETHRDHSYFLRSNLDLSLIMDETMYHVDPDFSTYYDVILARIIGYERYAVYLMKRENKLDNPSEDLIPSLESKPRYTWHSSKMDLIELIYALHAHQSEKGNPKSIKEYVEIAESIFDIELGNIYRAAMDLKFRKNPTQFLDELRG